VLQALARAAVDSGERVVTVEEAEELELGEGAHISLIGRGTQARQAIGYALRLKPDRLVIGDVRGAEALELTAAMTGGIDGVLCVVQAGSPRDVLTRLVSLAQLAPEAPTAAVLSDELARGVQVIVSMQRTPDGESRVAEICEVTANSDEPEVHSIFTAGNGRFAATGYVPAWAEGASPSLFRA
jgi:pilus assembly protein CpaF